MTNEQLEDGPNHEACAAQAAVVPTSLVHCRPYWEITVEALSKSVRSPDRLALVLTLLVGDTLFLEIL